MLPILVGTTTFGLDHMRASQQLGAMQKAADAAALASARQLAFIRVDSGEDEAGRDRRLALVADGIVQNTLDADFPETTTAATVLSEGQVEVALTARYGSLFGELGAFGDNPFTVTAIAQSFGGKNICFISFGTDEDDPGILMENSARLMGGTCEIYSSSDRRDSVKVVDSAHMEASLICAAGGFDGPRNNFSREPSTECPQIEDPLRDFLPPPMNPDCDHTDKKVYDAGSHTLEPGIYCGKVDVKDGADVWMNPGIYVFRDAYLHVHDDARLAGRGVGLYFDDKKAFFKFTGRAEVDLSAPVDGPMAGMLMAARPVCKDGITGATASATGTTTATATAGATGGGNTKCESGREFKITSSNVRSLLGTIHLPNDDLVIDTTMPVSEDAAFTIVVIGTIELSGSPTLVLNTDYALTDVPVPGGFRDETGVPRLVH